MYMIWPTSGAPSPKVIGVALNKKLPRHVANKKFFVNALPPHPFWGHTFKGTVYLHDQSRLSTGHGSSVCKMNTVTENYRIIYAAATVVLLLLVLCTSTTFCGVLFSVTYELI